MRSGSRDTLYLNHDYKNKTDKTDPASNIQSHLATFLRGSSHLDLLPEKQIAINVENASVVSLSNKQKPLIGSTEMTDLANPHDFKIPGLDIQPVLPMFTAFAFHNLDFVTEKVLDGSVCLLTVKVLIYYKCTVDA